MGSPRKPAGASATVERKPSPAIVWDAIWGFARSLALRSAVELHLFDHIAAGAETAPAIAAAAGASERGVRMLLDAMVGLRFLTKKKDRYALTDTAGVFLVSTSPGYMGGMVSHSLGLFEVWRSLTEVVRTGKPVQAVDLEAAGREFFPKLVGALFPSSFGASHMSREALPARARSRVKRVLDVASGACAWSLPWAIEDRQVRVTALDFPEVHEVARQFTDRFGVTDRYEFAEGNVRKKNFGVGKYDLVILGHICHSEGAANSRKLIHKSARALREGGLLLVGEFVPNDARTGPAGPLLFGLNMLVNTEEGDVFTLAEYRAWMSGAGLSSVRKLDLGPEGPDIIIGAKK